MKTSLTAALVAAAATTALTFAGPALASDGKHVVEGDAGSTKAKVSLELDAPVPHLPVTVHYSTHDGTATAGQDYLPRSGTVTFGAFETEREISVTVLGDTLYEGDETFFLSTGHESENEDDGHRITIVDDDPAPAVSISDATAGESNGSARFDVTLSAPSGRTTTVDYASADGTAAAPGDYAAKSGTLSFAPGETTKSLNVDVVNDSVHEDTEAFSLGLANPVGATLGTATGHATVLDDDALTAAPAVVHQAAPALAAQQVVTPAGAPAVSTTFERLTRSRAVLLKLACPSGPTACSGTIKLTRGAQVIGQREYALAPGTSGELGIRLSRKLRKQAARGQSLALSAIAGSGKAIHFTV